MSDQQEDQGVVFEGEGDRPEPAEIRSPSEEGNDDNADREEEDREEDKEGKEEEDVPINNTGLDQVDEEIVNQEEGEEVNGVNEDADDGPSSPSSPSQRKLLDSDDEGDRSSPIHHKSRQISDSDDEDEVVKRRVLDSDDEDEVVKRRVLDSDDEDEVVKRRVLNSDDEDEVVKSTSSRKRIVIPDDDSDGDEELKKLEARAQDSDEDEPMTKVVDSDEEESTTRTTIRTTTRTTVGKDTEDGDEESAEIDAEEKTDVIADIFGDSGSEGEDFEGFKKPEGESTAGEGEGAGTDSVSKDLESSSDEDEERRGSSQRSDMVYDFDIMMQKKREESYRRRKRKNIDIINDSDDVIAEMINQMKQAAEDDFNCNKEGKPALWKLKLLPQLEGPLKKIDLREALLDAGILSVITDWLTPLPDRSLPNIKVRETMLTALQDFHVNDTERLKASGVGKAVMYLFKHPKETRENKIRGHKLIQMWSRPIFNNETDFHSISREEREERDIEVMSGGKKSRSDEPAAKRPVPVEEKGPAPGEKGFIPRARVPAPSLRAYVTRPVSKVEESFPRPSTKKAVSRMEKLQRSFMEKKRASRGSRPVKVSIEGRKM